jgi:hypothetical protein
MSTSPADDHRPTGAPGDPFLVQFAWVVREAGGQEALARKARVSPRALVNWSGGDYPKRRTSATVEVVDAYAAAHLPGYPAAAGVPRLTETSGAAWRPAPEDDVPADPAPEDAARQDTAPADTAPAVTARQDAAPQDTEPARPSRWTRALAVAAAIAVVGALAAALTPDRDPDSGGANGAAPSSTVAEPALPTGPAGSVVEETTGTLGANTFADPRTLADQAMSIPASTTVSVRCRYHSPVIPSVSPDGWWYLVVSGKWAGRWTPANSFMNGDVPGEPTQHNTDFAVPVCE